MKNITLLLGSFVLGAGTGILVYAMSTGQVAVFEEQTLTNSYEFPIPSEGSWPSNQPSISWINEEHTAALSIKLDSNKLGLTDQAQAFDVGESAHVTVELLLGSDVQYTSDPTTGTGWLDRSEYDVFTATSGTARLWRTFTDEQMRLNEEGTDLLESVPDYETLFAEFNNLQFTDQDGQASGLTMGRIILDGFDRYPIFYE